MGGVALFRWGANAQGWSGDIDGADLFRPKAVIGHMAEPFEGPKTPGVGDVPAGFLHHLAVQGGQRVFSRVDPATRQLKLVVGFCLMGQKNVIAAQENGINPGSAAIGLPRNHGLAKASDHDAPLVRQLL